jgi:hypothetical protein
MKVKALLTIFTSVLVAGCSVIGQDNVETAPYTVLKSDLEQQIEVRVYDPMILVSTSMSSGSGNSAFRKLFKYITGANDGATEIAMTAPVIMDNEKQQNGAEIAMTAPVFMDESTSTPLMSFVMPKDFTLATTPKPTSPEVKVSELINYKVAAIQFSGTLSDSNVEEHSEILVAWMAKNGYTAAGKPVKAGYNGPLTLPWLRRNEVLIEIQ